MAMTSEDHPVQASHPLLEDLLTADEAEAQEIVWQIEYALQLCGVDPEGDPVGEFEKLARETDWNDQ